MKCVVTGGHGFIGGHIVTDLFARGHQVIVYDISNTPLVDIPASYQFVHGDIRNIANVQSVMENADVVFHLSGILGTCELFDDPLEAVQINVLGALNVILSAKSLPRRPKLFFPSKPIEWNNIYSLTSQAIEKLAFSYRDNFGMDIRMLRLRNVYGPGQKLAPVRKCVPQFVIQALTEEYLEVYGDGTQHVELQYIQDVTKRIIDRVFYTEESDIIPEVGMGATMSVTELALRIIEMTGSQARIKYLPKRIGEGLTYPMSCKAKDESNYVTPTEIYIGLRETINWYKIFLNRARHTIDTRHGDAQCVSA